VLASTTNRWRTSELSTRSYASLSLVAFPLTSRPARTPVPPRRAPATALPVPPLVRRHRVPPTTTTTHARRVPHFPRLWYRPTIPRRDPGLAASPPARYTLRVGRRVLLTTPAAHPGTTSRNRSGAGFPWGSQLGNRRCCSMWLASKISRISVSAPTAPRWMCSARAWLGVGYRVLSGRSGGIDCCHPAHEWFVVTKWVRPTRDRATTPTYHRALTGFPEAKTANSGRHAGS